MGAILPTSKGIDIGDNLDKDLRQSLGQKLLNWHILLAWLIIITLIPLFCSIKASCFFLNFFCYTQITKKLHVQITTGFSSPVSAVGHPGLISPFKESPAILLTDILIRFSQESQRRGKMELQ